MDKFLKSAFIILVFMLALSFFIHNFASINQDIGRHLKLGEIIWQEKSVPKTNLFSYTLSIFIFIDRTEVRPEIFSYLFLAFYLFALLEAKNRAVYRWLWFLPLVQLLWINAHIYFIIGPIIYFAFLADQFLNRQNKGFRRLILIGFLILFVNLLNPSGLDGALYPLSVLKDYGYDIVENKSIFFLAEYFNRWDASGKVFLVSLGLLALGMVLNLRIIRKKTFEFLISAIFAALALKMKRNVSLYALVLFPILAGFLNPAFESFWHKLKHRSRTIILWSLNFLLLILIILVVTNIFYAFAESPKKFGLDIPQSTQKAIDFTRENKISGPVFNNFDIGSYLIWQFYPEQKVFVDGRPEAYGSDFFSKIYKPMQSDSAVWKEAADDYSINYIFFAHTDITPWAIQFLSRTSKDPDWPLVFLNDSVVIFLRNNKVNAELISKFRVTQETFRDKIPDLLKEFNPKDDLPFRSLGSTLYNWGWHQDSALVYSGLIKAQPQNSFGYQGAGYAYAAIRQMEAQAAAASNLEQAIKLGLDKSSNYFILGAVYLNLGQREKARANLEKAIDLDPQNLEAVKLLNYIQ